MDEKPTDQAAVPSYALHCHALNELGDYREHSLASKYESRASRSRTESATQILQLITAVLGLLVTLLPLIGRLM